MNGTDSEPARADTPTPGFPTRPTAAGILFVTPWSPDAIGGVSEVLINLHWAFAARGGPVPRVLVEAYPMRSVTRMATETLGPVDCFYLMAPGRGVRHALAFLARLPAALLRLRGYLRRNAVRAINVHYPSLSLVSLVLARALHDPSRPLVLSFHGADLTAIRFARGVERRLWRFAIRHCTAVVACSQALASEVLAALPEADSKLTVIHNGVDIGTCRRAARSAPVPEILRGHRYLGCVATFEDKKGQDVLLAAFRGIAPAFPDLRLAFVGRSGPTIDTLRTAVGDALRDRVCFFPDRTHAEALAILSGAALLVHPARREPFGIVILEAAALDVPVVASRVGGIPEIVEDGRTGRLVPAEDPSALADAIAGLLNDPARAKTYAAALRARAASAFSWQSGAAAYARLFRV